MGFYFSLTHRPRNRALHSIHLPELHEEEGLLTGRRENPPVCFLCRWLCPRRAVIVPRLDTPPLTMWHTAGEHSTDLHTHTEEG